MHISLFTNVKVRPHTTAVRVEGGGGMKIARFFFFPFFSMIQNITYMCSARLNF